MYFRKIKVQYTSCFYFKNIIFYFNNVIKLLKNLSIIKSISIAVKLNFQFDLVKKKKKVFSKLVILREDRKNHCCLHEQHIRI